MILKTLRKEIRCCGKSRYRIAKETGIDEAQLCRFLKGQSFRCETADILLKYFGYELRKRKKRKKVMRK